MQMKLWCYKLTAIFRCVLVLFFVCESVDVDSDSIANNNKLNLTSVVRSKFADVILLNCVVIFS